MPGGGRGAAVPPWVSGDNWNGSSRKIHASLMSAWAESARQAKRRGSPIPEKPIWGDKSKNPVGWELPTQRVVAEREAAAAQQQQQ